ncbi:hypothetical protein PPMP20_37650 [Paraburkholderia phymatum]|uniref:hypothetical protein n=1 Tax=Paraburkholderia phymatum TaxID=148447 RepID=UPI0002E7862A|nr:hypothetical protein [Paraburkholderia phymatum]
MLTTHEVMRLLYLRGGEFSEEARAWLSGVDDDNDALGCIADTLDELDDGEIDEQTAFRKITSIVKTRASDDDDD